MFDTVGAGSEDFGTDGRLENGTWAPGAKGLRTGGQQSIWESMKVQKAADRSMKRMKHDKSLDEKPTSVVNPFAPFRKADGTIRETSWTSHEKRQDHKVGVTANADVTLLNRPEEELATEKAGPPQLFAGLTIYINGSTAPLISDHRLKHLLSAHGARTSVALGRRSVTHVILGRSNTAGGCGGGLAGSKIDKEIRRTGGKSVKFVNAAWVVDSVKAGKRLPETRYQGLKLSASGFDSVANLFNQDKRVDHSIASKPKDAG